MSNQEAYLRSVLAERDRADAESRLARMETESAARELLEREAAEKARAAAIEKCRRGAHIDAALRSGTPLDRLEAAVPSEGWPPGTDPSMFGAASIVTEAAPLTDAAQKALRQLMGG